MVRGRVVAVEKEEGDVPEEGERHEAQREMCREEEEKRYHPQRSSRRKDADSKNETHQKSHHAKCTADDQPDPNIDNPCAHHCSQERHTQPTEQSVWCVPAGQEEHSTHSQTYEELSSQENDQRDAP